MTVLDGGASSPSCFVKAHSFQVDLGALCKLTSGQSFHEISLNPVDAYRVKH